VFFTNFGVAYTVLIADVPASTGYGEPIQRLFKFRDGERVIAALSLDPRATPGVEAEQDGDVPRTHAVAVTSDGYSLRFGFQAFVEPSTRAGRRYARPSEGVEVVGVAKIDGSETIIAANGAGEGDALQGRRDQLPLRPGKGVILIKIKPKEDRVLASSPRSAIATC